MRIFVLSLALLAASCTVPAQPQSASTIPDPSIPVAITEVPYNAVPTKVLERDDAARLLNNSGVTLQWIGWEKRGKLDTGTVDGEIWLSGRQLAPDGERGELYLEGRAVEIGTGYFIFSGEISIIDTPDRDRVCKMVRNDIRFEVTQNRKYWRLREFEWCDELTDYIDIYF